MPLISIIVPVYNKVRYLDICIKSILKQTIKDFELILVNDGSNDGSGKKCDDYAVIDSRVRVIHQINSGVSKARNVGLEIATGDYIGFVDSDDMLDEDMYELLINNAREYNADISICGVRRVSSGKVQSFGGDENIVLYNRDEALDKLFSGEIMLSTYEKIFKNTIVKEIKYQPALFEDTFYNFEAIKNSNVIVHDYRIKYNYMIRENSHSMAAFNQKYMNTLIITKRMLEICRAEMPQHIERAKVFDFNQNMFVLNLIILSSKKEYLADYNKVNNNLKENFTLIKSKKNIGRKYKLGFYLFNFSPFLYTCVLNAFSKITNSEHLKRKRSALGPSVND